MQRKRPEQGGQTPPTLPETEPQMPPATEKKRGKGEKDAATAAEVLRELTDIGLGRREFVVLDRQGNPVDHPASVPERIRALELLAKYHRLMGTSPEPQVQPVRIIDDLEECATRDEAGAFDDSAPKDSSEEGGGDE